MIQLFATPQGVIDLSTYDNLLHGYLVERFEEYVAEYVGAKYACSFNSASSAIFLTLRMVKENWPHLLEGRKLAIPATIPPVVPNMILNAGAALQFVDSPEWIGHFYLLANFQTFKVIDSAQIIEEELFQHEADPQDLMIFSFYPTKPVGSIDGGMIVSNDSDKIECLRKMSMNGASPAINSWERTLECSGWKMYMNSAQAQIAEEQLSSLHERTCRLDIIRKQYDQAFKGTIPRPETEGQTRGYHLYRVYVVDNQNFVQLAKVTGIICGIHYRSLHQHPLYGRYAGEGSFVRSNVEHFCVVSIPFHAKLADKDIEKVINFTIEYQDRYGPPNCGQRAT